MGDPEKERDRREQIPDLACIPLCPPEVEDRLPLGRCNRSLNRAPLTFARTMTDDRGKEMAHHAQITQNTGVDIYFCDPHSPYQRRSNEKINAIHSHSSFMTNAHKTEY